MDDNEKIYLEEDMQESNKNRDASQEVNTKVEDDGIIYINKTTSVPGSIIKDDKKTPVTKMKTKTKVVIGAIALALIVVVVVCIGMFGRETYDWPSDGLATMLPKPSGAIVYLSDEDNKLEADVDNNSEKYSGYVEECKQMGFDETDDAGIEKYGDKSYTAFNEEGYKLSLAFQDYDGGEMEIELQAPIEENVIAWPNSGVGKKLPKPASLIGEVVEESAEELDIYIAGTDKTEYNKYIDKVKASGFSKDYLKENDHFEAEGKKDVEITVDYYGNNIMHIIAYDWGDDEDEDIDEDTDEEYDDSSYEEDSDTSQSTSSVDFKATMDEYEAFVDEYIAFMKKYNKSNNVSGMMADYSQMLSDYSTWASKIDKINENSLSTDDYNYYIEVTTRVLNKLSKANL